MFRKNRGLVESTLPPFAPVQRHRHDRVITLIVRKNTLQVTGQMTRQRLHSRILIQMNQAAQRAFVQTEAGGMIESAKSRTASRAHTLLVERVRIQKRRITNRAKVIGLQRSGGLKATGANRNAGPFGKGTLANTAVSRKKQRKNSVVKLVDSATEQIEGGRSRYRTTREGAPP